MFEITEFVCRNSVLHAGWSETYTASPADVPRSSLPCGGQNFHTHLVLSVNRKNKHYNANRSQF